MRWFLSLFGLALLRDLEDLEEDFRTSQELVRDWRQDYGILKMRKLAVESDLKELAQWVRSCCHYNDESVIDEIVNRSRG